MQEGRQARVSPFARGVERGPRDRHRFGTVPKVYGLSAHVRPDAGLEHGVASQQGVAQAGVPPVAGLVVLARVV